MTWFGWALLTAFVWGVVPIFEKIGLKNVEPFAALFYRCLGVLLGVLVLLSFRVTSQQLKAVSFRSIMFLVSAGFLASFVAQVFFYQGLKIADVSKIVPIAGSFPLFAFVFGVCFLGETLTIAKVIGALMIVGGIWVIKAG
ncbi:MAG: EamA family transporter [Candidatus Omnitrophica bacterium]|nr:EamA family transporter [Candidatus Omnitrophota bacterium]